MITLSAVSRTTSSSNSFHPSTLSSTSSVELGLAFSPWRQTASNSSEL